MGTLHTEVCGMLGIDYPILQGGMGPYGTMKLAAAVSNAGGLGTISNRQSNIPPAEARRRWEEAFEMVCDATDRPFAANLPLGAEGHTPQFIIEAVDAYMETALRLKREDDRVAEQFRVMITSAGNPARWHDEIADAGLLHFHKVGSVRHARKVEEVGGDAVIASGFEMGGHTHQPDDAVHTFVLVPAIAEAVDIPVIAAGGVRDGRGLLGALSLGADAVSMGTRFIATEEADFHENYKRRILDAGENEDRLVGGFYGPALRGIETEGMDELARVQDEGLDPEDYVDFEYEKFEAAQQDGNVDDGVVSAGQVACYIDDCPAVADLLHRMVEEAERRADELPVWSTPGRED